MIPQDKMEAVCRGLSNAFGTTVIEDIEPITKGLSSDLTFRLVVNRAPFILKIMTRVNEQNDPHRIFAARTVAAEAGLTPHVWYASVTDGISIIDFVDAVPLTQAEARVLVPQTLQRLHGLARPAKAFNYVTAHNGFIWRFRTANLVPPPEALAAFQRYEQLCAVYPRLESDMVFSHNDVKPENLLFDGQRVWLVDWQAAFSNDRYFDLAIVGNFVVTDDAEEIAYLEAYFGQPPNAYQRARFFLMRQMMHLFYASVFLLLGGEGNDADEDDLPAFHNFHQQIWSGNVDLADVKMRRVYGRIHWIQLLQNLQKARFDESLTTVAGNADAAESGRLLPLPAAG